MTKEITKAYILQEIQDKFKLRELEPETFRFSEMVVPVYNIEKHLERVEIDYKTISITATGSVEFFRVPMDEKWTVHRYMVMFLTGNFTSTGLLITRTAIATHYMYLDLKTGVTASYLNDLPKAVLLNPGDGVYVNVTGYVATGDMKVMIDATKETIR